MNLFIAVGLLFYIAQLEENKNKEVEQGALGAIGRKFWGECHKTHY